MSVFGVCSPQSAEEVHVLLIVPKVESCLLFDRMRLSSAAARKRKGRKGGRTFSASHVISSPLQHNFL